MVKTWIQVTAQITAPADYTFHPTDGSLCRANFANVATTISAGNSAVTELFNLYNDILQTLNTKNVDLTGNKDF